MSWIPSGEVVLLDEGVRRVRRGERNIYRKWISRVRGPVAPGDVVVLLDEEGAVLGEGFFEDIGAMGVRVLSNDPAERIDSEHMREKLERCLELRLKMGLGNFFRLVHSEADGLPGLIIDVYNDVGVITSTALGFDRRIETIASSLMRIMKLRAIFLRNDTRTRKEVGLPMERRILAGHGDPETQIQEGNVLFHVNVIEGQKTGFFIDQRINRELIERYVSTGDRVLDLFSYTGGFGLHAAINGAKVVMVDESEYAQKEALRNAELNGVKVEFVRSRVREFLERDKRTYDLIVVDPPALIPSRDLYKVGYRTYTRINRSAMSRVIDLGFLFSSSCSMFLTKRDLRKILLKCAEELGRKIRFLGGVLGQSPDHPVDPLHPWTGYLKGFLISVEC